jgi:hypothetical protein
MPDASASQRFFFGHLLGKTIRYLPAPVAGCSSDFNHF